MANGYISVSIKDMNDAGLWLSTAARVEFRKQPTGHLLRTVYLTKPGGDEFWRFTTALVPLT
jgi:hypothetical protein